MNKEWILYKQFCKSTGLTEGKFETLKLFIEVVKI